MQFFLGTHEPAWLNRTTTPLMVSAHRLARRKTYNRATTEWALDSGGFSTLSQHGSWRTTPEQYAAQVAIWSAEISTPAWAAVQDWMCEPLILQKTGKSVIEHQHNTIDSLIALRQLRPQTRWLPILQGWQPAEYLNHVTLYAKAGVHLAAEPLVGIGSICRRQHTHEISQLLATLVSTHHLRLHGFGVKSLGLPALARYLVSADSLAWSIHARRRPPLRGCTHASCANCMKYALQWKKRLIDPHTTPQKSPPIFDNPPPNRR